jgi:hypothetical protein
MHATLLAIPLLIQLPPGNIGRPAFVLRGF